MDRRELQQNESAGSMIDQITEEDIRFYYDEAKDVYVPSVTTVLDVLPKPDLQFWRDKVGADTANKIAYEAAVSGTKVHNGIEDLCIQLLENGEANLSWLDQYGYKKYKAYEWEGILKFVDFYENFVDTIIACEVRVASVAHNVGGTIDMLCYLTDGRLALVDHKFSNSLSDTYSVQTFIYKKLWEEHSGVSPDVRGNLWLKAQTRGRDKKNESIQGKGWKLVEHSDDHRDGIVWECASKLFADLHRKKVLIPEIKKYQSTINLKLK
jgi:hypothetical protein